MLYDRIVDFSISKYELVLIFDHLEHGVRNATFHCEPQFDDELVSGKYVIDIGLAGNVRSNITVTLASF